MWTISILNILCIWRSYLGPSNMDPEGRASTTPYLACCIQLSSLMLWGTRVIAFLRSAFFLRGGHLQNPVQNLKVFAQQLPIIVTVRNALWIDVSRFFSGCSASCSVIFLAICSILELELPCLRYLQHCRLKVLFLFKTFAHKSDSHLETGRAI